MMQKTTAWRTPSNLGLVSVLFSPTGLLGDAIIGKLVLQTDSLERRDQPLWLMTIGPVPVQVSTLRSVLVAMSGWLAETSSFSLLLVDDEVQVRMVLKTEDDQLLLGYGKAALHFCPTGIGLLDCDVPLIVDEGCIRDSMSSLRLMLDSLDVDLGGAPLEDPI